MRSLTVVRYPWTVGLRITFLAATAALLAPLSASAQTYATATARRHFISVSYDWLYTLPLHFAEHPLEDLVGREVTTARFEIYDYRTRDGEILIDVIEFKRRANAFGATLFPFGMSKGATLALRGSIEGLPLIRIDFAGPSPVAAYTLTDAKSLDFGAGVFVADRSPGWGLGSHAFVLAGFGRITSDLGDGDRYFAEGGGGVSSGPIGVELSVKFAWNNLSEPVDHSFLTIPIAIRGTLTF
jgi:hypothetical protein